MPPPRHSSPGSKAEKKTISQDELDKMTERLTRVPKRTDLPPLVAKKSITDEDLQKQINRLYDQSIETKKRKMEKAAKNEEASIPQSRKLTEEEVAESVARQYTQALQVKATKQEQLKKKFLFNPHAAAAEGSFTSSSALTPRTKAEQKAIGERLYGESIAKKKESMEKLLNKYVYSTGPQTKTISTEEAKEAADRLSAP